MRKGTIAIALLIGKCHNKNFSKSSLLCSKVLSSISVMKDDFRPRASPTVFPWGKWVRLILFAILFVSVGLLLWRMWNRSSELEASLRRTEHERQLLDQKLATLRSQSNSMRKATDSAEMRAAHAEVEAERLNETRRRIELERELARETAEHYRDKSVQARHDAAQARIETDRIRQQRETELDRMQQALSHIVETERTPIGMIVNLGKDSFLFDFDQSVIRPENREILSRIAGVLLASHGFRLYIYGHTDNLGSADYNHALSNRRARAVRNYLVLAGVPETVVETKGFGESSPIIKAQSSVARQRNRRVEIGIVDTIIHYAEEIRD